METKHINNVVLYAKNFYRHTGDVIKDMQRFMQMDGHKWHKIDTPEKVLKVMRADYIKWAESIDDEVERKSLLDSVDDKVWWAEGAAATIWIYLIRYNGSHIPMSSVYLDGPKYDKYHLPQFNIREINFSKNMTFNEMNKTANDFLSISQEDDMDDYMNRLLDKYDFEMVHAIFNKIGEHVDDYHDLSDEVWNLYVGFMSEHVHDGVVDAGYFHLYSDHFHLEINTQNSKVWFDLHAIFHKYTVSCTNNSDIDLNTGFTNLWDSMVTCDEFQNSCNIAKLVTDVMEENKLDDGFAECATDPDATKDCHYDILETIKRETFTKWSTNLNENNNTVWGTGGHSYYINYHPNNDGTYTSEVSVLLEGVFACEIKESNLRNIRSCMAGDVLM